MKRPEPTRRKSTRRCEEPILPDIKLTTVAEEEDGKVGTNPSLERPKSGFTRIVISRNPKLFTGQRSSRSSIPAEPGGPSNTDRQPLVEAASRSDTPFRNSAMSDVSTSWMTAVTQKTDGEFVPTTALRYPGVRVPARQPQGPGPPVEKQSKPVQAPGPSRWLSPPSWRVVARRSLGLSLKSEDRRSRGSPSDSEKSQLEKEVRG